MTESTPFARSTSRPRRWLTGWLLGFLSLWSLAAVAPAHAAQPGIDWTLQTTPPGSLGLNTVTYGVGKFVALTYPPTTTAGVLTSPNGHDWTLGTMPANRLWTGVTYADGKFVTVMSKNTMGQIGGVMTSPDGVTWTERTAPDNTWSSVIYGGGTFVAVTQSLDGSVMTSPNGIDWTLQNPANGCYWRSVTYGNGTFVAVATRTGPCQGKLVMTSSNGVTWTQRITPDLDWMAVTYANGKFVAVAQSLAPTRPGAVMTSDDGVTWTQQTPVPNCNWRSVAYGSGLFVAISSSDGRTFECLGKRVMTSPDGIAWTLRTSAADFTWTSVTYGNGLFVAVASNGTGNQVMTSGDVCGEGIPLTTGAGALWQQLALPCVPTTATVQGALGSGNPGNLLAGNYNSANYNTSANWWRFYHYNASAPSYVLPALGDAVFTGTGYWLKSFDAPVGNGNLSVTGTATVPDVTPAQGCAVAAGCKAIGLTVAANRYNLVGNPFPYKVDWSKVRIRVDASSSTLTPTAAETAGFLSKQIWIWNGNTYQTWDDVTNKGNLQYFQSFWVKVLPGADTHTLELLIPAEASTLSQAAPAALPWYLAWLDWVATPAHAADSEWQVRLQVENRVTGWKDTTNLLGQKTTAQTGYDPHDLIGMAPFATPYLSLVFPHADWPRSPDGQKRAGDYDTDFRPATGNPATDWAFELRGSPTGGKVFITWQADPAILQRSRLVDLQTGAVIDPHAGRYAQGYPVALKASPQRYQWRYLGR